MGRDRSFDLLKTLYKVQEGIVYSEKYARLFDSYYSER